MNTQIRSRRHLPLAALAFALIFSSCQSMVTKHQQAEQRKDGTLVVTTQPVSSPPEEALPPLESQPAPPVLPREVPALPVPSQRPHLALILGPGGLRSFAHAGLLQEVAKAKIPVWWIGGMEMGALPAALFALKGQPFEAEWQMMKLKEEDLVHSGILTGSAPLKADTLGEPLKLMFGGARAEDAKIAMMCSSYSLAKRQTYMMNRGAFAQMLQYCLPASPLFEPFQGNGANPLALAAMAQTARQKGAQLVVYVDLLTDNAISEADGGFLWGLFQQGIEAQSRSVNETFRVSGLSGLRAFDKRREMLQRGQEAGRRLVQLLQTKYGY